MLRWTIHYNKRNEDYEALTKRLSELKIPYRSEGGAESLILVTPAGRFEGQSALELVI